MADARLRQAEREAKQDPQARAAFLRERLRAGLIQPELIELAAYVGDEAAREVLGPVWLAWDFPGGGSSTLTDPWSEIEAPLETWSRFLPRWEGAPLRTAVAAARVALKSKPCGRCRPTRQSGRTIYEAYMEPCPKCGDRIARDPAPLRAIEAAEEWMVCPCEEHRRTWLGRFRAAMRGGLTLVPCPGDPIETTADLMESAARLTSEQAVRAAILAEVAPWALGERDVVRERVEARHGR